GGEPEPRQAGGEADEADTGAGVVHRGAGGGAVQARALSVLERRWGVGVGNLRPREASASRGRCYYPPLPTPQLVHQVVAHGLAPPTSPTYIQTVSSNVPW